jgi:hypothetical protein
MPFYESDIEELDLRDVQQARLAFADDSGSLARFVERRRCSTSPWIPREKTRICRPLEHRGCGPSIHRRIELARSGQEDPGLRKE